MQKILPKSKLNDFLKKLMQKHQVIAPVKEENTKFKILNNQNLKKLYLKKITQVPVKKFFIPDNEILLEYKNDKLIEKKDSTLPRIIFGLRKCDINALLVLDKIMQDPLYISKRKNTIIIGLYCENPDEYCFCKSMELSEKGYDLFFYPDRKNYYISIGSKKGEKLVSNLAVAKKQVIKQIKNTKKLPDKNIENHYRDKIWESDAEKCLSCSACTVYCPTCNCFDIKDNLDVNLKNGERFRKETSCQLKSFTRVAGGKSYRDSRLSRFKHFVYHKIDYFKKQHEVYMCVGCGRCLRVCPTNIDWINTINLLKGIKK
ncbi:hypothetical protein GF386_05375 [Candidatus Pacearchaeota archaeon]|nr:hypothetical protein [Candidatus Pacearchaeota archaeon]MBD3283519.1 hypothetical protein [Candidatus Pacearchaeota archaeon]